MSTLTRLQSILQKYYDLPAEILVPEATLETLGIDSMSTIDLLFNVEDEFGITIGRDPVDLKTIDDIVVYIDRLCAEQQKLAVESPRH